MPSVTELFPGPRKRAILRALHGASGPVYAADLCQTVFGSRAASHRATLRNLIAQMRPKLAEHGYAIDGRNELKMNAYLLRLDVL